jgi:acyl-CoA dehydrogenase
VVIIDLLILLAIVLGFAYFRTNRLVWTAALAVILVIVSVFELAPMGLLIPVWVIFLGAAAFANLAFLRCAFITRPLIKIFRKVLPPMSQTEREALEAGNVWWEGELFQGNPDWKKLHDYPKPSLSKEEEAFLDNQVETLCKMIDDWKVVRNHDLSPDVWDYLRKEKFFGMLIPKEFGGLAFSALAQSTIVTKIATRSVSAAVTTMVPNSLGPAELLLHYGTDEQKKYYLPKLANGTEIPCFGLTSAEGGSDAGAMPGRGVVCKGMHEGKEVLGIKLNFNKRYITLAPVATVLGIAFKLQDPDHLIGDKTNRGITCALVPADHPGISVGKRHYPVYMSFMNGPIHAKDVFIPMEWIIGGVEMVGQGWRMLMECLSAGRGISLPALSTAAAKLAYRTTGAYSKVRKQFNVSIGNFEGVEEYLAKIGGLTYMLESSRMMTAGAIDMGVKPSLVSAIAKYHMTEMCREVADACMDIHAGRGIQAGPRNYAVNMYLSMPVAITVEGANILTRNLMIFGQGAVRCHPYTFDEMQALSNENLSEGLKQFDRLFVSHIGYGLSNFARSLVMGITGAHWISAGKSGPTAKYYKQLTRMSSALALVSDIIMMKLGGELKRKESLSARLGDVLSYLYLASTVLKYYEDNGSKKEDLLHVKWCVQYCLYHIQKAFYGVFDNFPGKGWGSFLRLVVFPFGKPYKFPKDKLTQQIAQMTMQPGEFRDRITKHAFIGNHADDVTGRVELAFQRMIEVAPLLKRMNTAIKKGLVPKGGNSDEKLQAAEKNQVFNIEELKALREFNTLRVDVLEVDEFPEDYFKIQEAW